jgi:hypothetical protein
LSAGGCLATALGKAIEKSRMVVIFVSSESAKSYWCGKEHCSAARRQKEHGIKIVYVIVDQNYSDASGGTLAFLKGLDFHYNLWEVSHIEQTARAIAVMLEDCPSVRR